MNLMPGISSDLDDDDIPYGELSMAVAADMLVHMPKLQTMELWCGDRDHGLLFRFETFQGSTTTPPTITIGTTWDLREDSHEDAHGHQIEWFTPKVQSVWTEKARQYSQLPLVVKNIALPQIQSPAGHHLWAYMEVLDKLALRDLVIDPVSYYDMTQDATHGTDGDDM